MVFNDTIGGQGIVQDTYFESQSSATSYPIADLTRNANNALDTIGGQGIVQDTYFESQSSAIG